MINKDYFKAGHPKPVCVGTGLVALDVVINGNPNSPPRLWIGGSCGNVLTILSFLGWESYPVARLRDDVAGGELLKDLDRWKVKTILISRNNSGSTPIIIEKIGVNKSGIPWHRFEWVCPNCGSWFPRYKPVLTRDIEKISKQLPKSHVFYFDRVVPSSVQLAKISKNNGALVVFEPSGIKEERLFYECLKVADIVKYSHERLGHAQEFTEEVNIPLEIETLGAAGLRYRLGRISKQHRKWKIMQAYPVTKLVDAAGAGDWCSAGIIHFVGSSGRKSFQNAEAKDIEMALSFGQALAALNCNYEGARGSMYKISRQKFEALICRDVRPSDSTEENELEKNLQSLKGVCPSCLKKGSVK